MNINNKFFVLALLFISVVINYMDRTNISVAAKFIADDLDLTSVQMGVIFSAFAWTYSAMQIPGGMIVDAVRVRILYPVILVAWSLATIVQGLVTSLAAMVGCRMAVGMFEAPSYPTNNKIVTHWFAERQRASAIAVYTSGQFIGLAFLMPILAVIQEWFGWRGLFIISGLIGIAWAAVWYFMYREPGEKDVGSELCADDNERQADPSWTNIRFALTNRKLWGIYIGQFCLGSTLIFFLTWFPTYLAEYRGLDNLKTGFWASIPFTAAFFGVLCSGFTSDWLVKRGYSNEFARKTPVIVGLLLSGTVIAANYVESMAAVTFFLSLAFFGNGLASINWVFVSLVAPRHMVGLVGGCFNFIGGLSAVVIPVAIGFLVQDGDFRPALLLIGGLALVGMCSYLFLVGRVEEIRVPGQEVETLSV
ncbi:MFS transporter [Microbulbifer thermotolerans]|uniref:MFS transporter n=1 Tax=Microbulbifer thermotolerans TaxID=252514 RepID=A0AB35I1S1_MICTH|nr:MFS transporter [Microbulbifer thermotolerans]MCX2780464.1 MFS transporter [Microbulbifer thermotolerans]MCX2784599.1 MFS transporter [Microbulbifer thermotolerans]MCX2802941.1 MFS transporter [Microbulbifer thermotolerans]MCX2806000.1 MFS transporter [Microbulbifer thermotolerans]MCX2835788.1 MFS transporter [Microbulbifer thermotolerans]